VKQASVERRRFAIEVWNELLKWTVVILLIASTISTAVCLHFHLPIIFPMYLGEFFISLAVSWFMLMRRKFVRKEFKGDD
jgi:hypothetical protein